MYKIQINFNKQQLVQHQDNNKKFRKKYKVKMKDKNMIEKEVKILIQKKMIFRITNL